MELPAVGNFIERPILHDPADINRSAECCHDKTDVAGNEVIGIEDGAIQSLRMQGRLPKMKVKINAVLMALT